jgi:hypothetical protein
MHDLNKIPIHDEKFNKILVCKLFLNAAFFDFHGPGIRRNIWVSLPDQGRGRIGFPGKNN